MVASSANINLHKLNKSYNNIQNNFLGVDSCNGDSGGPLAYKKSKPEDPWYLIGIVSYGTSLCGKGSPGVYTKVTSYLDWIERNMKP